MPDRIFYWRQKANECRDRAALASDAEFKRQWKLMAAEWDELADTREAEMAPDVKPTE